METNPEVDVPDDALDERARWAWHARRHRAIAHAHPEVRALQGPDRITAVFVVFTVALQVAIAWALSGRPLWLAAIVGYTFGSIVAHALGVLIHEAAHDLLFAAKWKNRVMSILANVPLLAPGAIDFREKHLRHHRWLDETRDPQRPRQVEVDLVRASPLRKIVWLEVSAMLFQMLPAPGERMKRPSAWELANIVACALFVFAVLWFLGFSSFTYLGIAGLFAFGPHPVGIRRYAEHVTLARTQPTNSYYGPFNLFSYNVGYHVEHHDFPSIGWRRLPRLRRLASTHYDRLLSVRSWTGLLLRLIVDPSYGVARYSGTFERRTTDGRVPEGPPSHTSTGARAA